MKPTVYIFTPYRLLPQQRQLLGAGDEPVKLGGRAFDVLLALVERRDRTVGKHELIELVWPHLVVEENNLQVHMVALRKLLGHAAIATVPGRGYRFTLPVQVEGQSPPTAPASAPGFNDGPKRHHNLPLQLPELIGRERDVRTVLGLLDRHALVTIAGAGGIGKTRLAQAVAAALLEARPDGVWWVDLSALSDDQRVPDAVAQATALGASSDGADAVAALWARLPTLAPLLVLDNAEHVLPGVAAFVARVQRDAPRTQLLVTSQEVLRLADEQVFRPEPLALPDGDDPVAIEASAAVALFVARAQAASRRFALDAENRVGVAEICRRLDGIPLAIELAAARVELLGVEGLREKLDQRFHVLTAGHRSTLRRHQTLRAALEWSHQLLSASEQAVLRRLSVFAGGFALDAAQHVAEDDDGIDRWDVLEHLGALVDKSLVSAQGGPTPRYRMLETTRLFAMERLVESGETAAVRERHRDHFLAVAEACQARLLSANARRHLIRLDLERDNLLLALAWAGARGDAEPGLRLASALTHYWYLRGLPALGLQVTRDVLERKGAQEPTLARCRSLVTAGWMSTWAGDDSSSVLYLQEALQLARSLSDAPTLCLALTRFAHVRHHRQEVDDAEQLAEQALALARTLDDGVALGDALSIRAHVHRRRGERDAARRLFEEALALRQQLDTPTGIISTRLNLAFMAVEDGIPEQGRPHLCDVLALLPVADSRIAGIHLMAVVAQWAAVADQHEDSVLLEAACDGQLKRAGLRNELEPDEVQRLARSAQSLSAETRTRLESQGRALDYDEALQAVADALAPRRGQAHRSPPSHG